MSSQRFGSEYFKATGSGNLDDIDDNPSSDHDGSGMIDGQEEEGSIEAFLNGAG